ncbi:hypothetical protein D3C85_1572900 [compost metagenome]
MFRTTIESYGPVDGETKLAGDHHLVSNRLQSFTDQFFVGIGAIHFCGVEEGDTFFKGCAKRVDALADVRWRSIVGTDAHTTSAHC